MITLDAYRTMLLHREEHPNNLFIAKVRKDYLQDFNSPVVLFVKINPPPPLRRASDTYTLIDPKTGSPLENHSADKFYDVRSLDSNNAVRLVTGKNALFTGRGKKPYKKVSYFENYAVIFPPGIFTDPKLGTLAISGSEISITLSHTNDVKLTRTPYFRYTLFDEKQKHIGTLSTNFQTKRSSIRFNEKQIATFNSSGGRKPLALTKTQLRDLVEG